MRFLTQVQDDAPQLTTPHDGERDLANHDSLCSLSENNPAQTHSPKLQVHRMELYLDVCLTYPYHTRDSMIGKVEFI